MPLLHKNWDDHVVNAEDVSRTEAFAELRDRILALAAPRPEDVVVDLGAGTGLLTLAFAPRVRRIWAIDISPPMCDYLMTKAASNGLSNVTAAVATVTSLPLGDGVADLVISNYCFHHLRDSEKDRALDEIRRVLVPGGRVVFADMMFRVGLARPRDRAVVLSKLRLLLGRGLPGARRVLRHVARQLTGRGEHPAGSDWWASALLRHGFSDVHVDLLAHEGGVATARYLGALRRGLSVELPRAAVG